MNVENLTGKELNELSDVLDVPFMQAMENIEDTGDFNAVFALIWIEERRDDPDLTFEQVLETTTMADAVAAMASVTVTDGPKGSSGGDSPGSATTGG